MAVRRTLTHSFLVSFLCFLQHWKRFQCSLSSASTEHAAAATTTALGSIQNGKTFTEPHLDESIQKSGLALELNPRRSPHPSVFRLPTEILEIIFIHCARDTHYYGCGFPAPTAPSWVSVSYVCRHWRNVALNCPNLWTYLSLWSPRWRKESLARSNRRPLKICINLGCPGDASSFQLGLGFVRQLMVHAKRIHEFCLHLHSAYANSILPKALLCARCTQTLRVHNTSLSFPRVHFRGDALALRNLHLTDSPVSLRSLELGGLTTLSLHGHSIRFQQDTAEFLVMLSCMKDLEHLYLKHVLAGATGFLSSAEFRTFQKFGLPNLSRLWIAASPSTVIALLSCANIPLATELRLDCCFEPGSTSFDDYLPLCSLLEQRFGMADDLVASGPTIRSLVIKPSNWGKETLTFSASERDCNPASSLSGTDWGCNIILKITIDYFPGLTISDAIRVMGDICCSVPMGNVRSVHVVDPPLSLAFWRKLLAHLRDLRYLKLSAGDMPNLACLLSLDPRCADTESQGLGLDQPLVPALEELELYDILLPAIPLESDATVPPAPDIQSLYDALSSRKESRGRLVMARCPVASSAFETELDMVGRWDGGQFHVDSMAVDVVACRPFDGSISF